MATFSEIINSDKPVLVDFYTGSSKLCAAMTPIVNHLKVVVGDHATILKIDVDKNPSAATAYKIQGVPTLIIFKKGQIKWRRSGIISADSLKQLMLLNA